MVRRVEPGALVAWGERLQHALDLLPGGRAADQAVIGDALPDLESRAVLAAVHVHGHGHPGFSLANGHQRSRGFTASYSWRVTSQKRRGSPGTIPSTHHELSDAALTKPSRTARPHPRLPGHRVSAPGRGA